MSTKMSDIDREFAIFCASEKAREEKEAKEKLELEAKQKMESAIEKLNAKPEPEEKPDFTNWEKFKELRETDAYKEKYMGVRNTDKVREACVPLGQSDDAKPDTKDSAAYMKWSRGSSAGIRALGLDRLGDKAPYYRAKLLELEAEGK